MKNRIRSPRVGKWNESHNIVNVFTILSSVGPFWIAEAIATTSMGMGMGMKSGVKERNKRVQRSIIDDQWGKREWKGRCSELWRKKIINTRNWYLSTTVVVKWNVFILRAACCHIPQHHGMEYLTEYFVQFAHPKFNWIPCTYKTVTK